MSKMVEINVTESEGGGTGMATRGKAFKGKRRAALVHLTRVLERAIANDLRARERAGENASNDEFLFPTATSLNQVNAVLTRVRNALAK